MSKDRMIIDTGRPVSVRERSRAIMCLIARNRLIRPEDPGQLCRISRNLTCVHRAHLRCDTNMRHNLSHQLVKILTR